jgi:glycerol-3-phosphate dehydrogenase
VPTIYRVVELASEYGIKMPICEEMKNILDGVSTPAEALKNLLKRPQKREFLNI